MMTTPNLTLEKVRARVKNTGQPMVEEEAAGWFDGFKRKDPFNNKYARSLGETNNIKQALKQAMIRTHKFEDIIDLGGAHNWFEFSIRGLETNKERQKAVDLLQKEIGGQAEDRDVLIKEWWFDIPTSIPDRPVQITVWFGAHKRGSDGEKLPRGLINIGGRENYKPRSKPTDRWLKNVDQDSWNYFAPAPPQPEQKTETSSSDLDLDLESNSDLDGQDQGILEGIEIPPGLPNRDENGDIEFNNDPNEVPVEGNDEDGGEWQLDEDQQQEESSDLDLDSDGIIDLDQDVLPEIDPPFDGQEQDQALPIDYNHPEVEVTRNGDTDMDIDVAGIKIQDIGQRLIQPLYAQFLPNISPDVLKQLQLAFDLVNTDQSEVTINVDNSLSQQDLEDLFIGFCVTYLATSLGLNEHELKYSKMSRLLNLIRDQVRTRNILLAVQSTVKDLDQMINLAREQL